jgi:hypothetical protein
MAFCPPKGLAQTKTYCPTNLACTGTAAQTDAASAVFKAVTLNGSRTHAGSETFNGAVTVRNDTGNATLASGSSDGAIFVSTTGNDANTGLSRGAAKFTLAAALSACPREGCSVRFGDGNYNLGSFDPGTRSVTLHLGHGTYTVAQITLRNNLHIIGSGSNSSNPSAAPHAGTELVQSAAGTAPFVLPASASASGVLLERFRLDAANGSTTDGMNLVASTSPPGGLWYSTFNDINIGSSRPFGLDAIHFVGGTAGINQFDTFSQVFAARGNASHYALEIEGFNDSLKFDNCEFDGAVTGPGGDHGTNIYVHDTSGGTFPPYNIQFNLLTAQWAGVGIQINGADGVIIVNPHFEGDYGAVAVGSGASFASIGVVVSGGGAYNHTGRNRGAGYDFNMQAASTNAALVVTGFHDHTIADNFEIGNTAGMDSCGNMQGPEGSYRWLPCYNQATFHIPGLVLGNEAFDVSALSAGRTHTAVNSASREIPWDGSSYTPDLPMFLHAGSTLPGSPTNGQFWGYNGTSQGWHTPMVLSGTLTTTGAASDSLTVAGLTAASHCAFSPANASAAANYSTSYVSAYRTNSVTLTHTATSGMIYTFVCTVN